MQEGDSVTPHTSTTVDKGDAGYDKALKNRHLQMIAIGGSIGTGLFPVSYTHLRAHET